MASARRARDSVTQRLFTSCMQETWFPKVCTWPRNLEFSKQATETHNSVEKWTFNKDLVTNVTNIGLTVQRQSYGTNELSALSSLTTRVQLYSHTWDCWQEWPVKHNHTWNPCKISFFLLDINKKSPLSHIQYEKKRRLRFGKDLKNITDSPGLQSRFYIIIINLIQIQIILPIQFAFISQLFVYLNNCPICF